ncbi:unnamed protein product [Protopolystoma xenopodis]|uniref:Tektin n=1 Tax=Protopolystoma xenopodis TaxID=117903 RepID=A0A448WW03_9PLAT|nr:unnamed protein product [Protopolystoma xenopodis]
MARLINPSKYYSNEEWAHSNNFNYAIAEKERENATALENEIDRLIDETNKRTDNTLADVNKKLDQRLNDIKFWKDEINKKLSDLTDETKQLDQCIPRLIKALEATDEPLHFAEQCVLNREGRKGIDLVSDDAHKNLLKEIDIYTTVQDLLKKCIEQADEQIRLNRKSIYILKKDSTDKLEAQHIEEYGRNLKTNHEVREEGKSFTPEEWQNSAADRVLSADSQIKNSRDLRSTLDGTLQQVATDQRNQVEATNLALAKRISETRNAKGELEEHLALLK